MDLAYGAGCFFDAMANAPGDEVVGATRGGAGESRSCDAYCQRAVILSVHGWTRSGAANVVGAGSTIGRMTDALVRALVFPPRRRDVRRDMTSVRPVLRYLREPPMARPARCHHIKLEGDRKSVV